MLKIFSSHIAPISVFIPIFFGIKYYNALSFPYKIILWFTIFSGVVNYTNTYLVIWYLRSNSIGLINFYTVFEFLFLSAFYREFQGKTGKVVISVLMALFTILCIVNYLYIQNGSSFNTYTRTAEGVMIVAYCVQFLFRQGEKEHESNWGDNGLNWINAGVLIYYSCGIFIFMLFNYLITAGLFINQVVWGLVNTMMIIEYILYAIGFYKCKTHPKTS